MKSLTTLFFLLVAVCTHAQKKDLKLHLQLNKTYYLDQLSSSMVHTEYLGSVTDIEVVLDARIRYLVKATKEQEYTLEVTYERLSFEMTMMGREFKGSSDDSTATDELSRLFSAMTQGSFELDVTDYGEVKAVRGAQDMLLEAVMTLEDMSDEKKAQLYTQMLPTIGDKAIEGSMELLTLIYPQKSVDVGGQWTTKTRLAGQINAEVENTFSYSGKQDNLDFIDGIGKIDFSNQAVNGVGGVEYHYFLDGEVKTHFELDVNTGWIRAAKYDQFFAGYMIMNSPEGGEVRVPMSMRSNVVCK